MRFNLSPTQRDLCDGASEFLRAHCTPQLLRQLRDSEDKNPKLWQALAEQGITAVLGSEAHGGLGLNAVDFVLIAEQAGYVALPEPLSEVAGVSMAVLNALGMPEQCSAIADGQLRVLPVHSSNPFINQLQANDYLLQLEPSQISLHKVSDCKLSPAVSIDPLRQLNQVEFTADSGQLLAQGAQAAALTTLARQHGALFSAAELLGLAAAMVDMSSQYAQQRQQFGKAIGSFQAVKHHLANALIGIEFARPIMLKAAADIARCSNATERAVAHAKLAASDAAMQAAEIAIQVHGGMGYTFEVDLHLWMKRVWALAGLWGDRHVQMNILDKAIFTDGLAIDPSAVFN